MNWRLALDVILEFTKNLLPARVSHRILRKLKNDVKDRVFTDINTIYFIFI